MPCLWAAFFLSAGLSRYCVHSGHRKAQSPESALFLPY
nr:MAG TPA: hypothetical protein [Caudoviricetes sp.]